MKTASSRTARRVPCLPWRQYHDYLKTSIDATLTEIPRLFVTVCVQDNFACKRQSQPGVAWCRFGEWTGRRKCGQQRRARLDLVSTALPPPFTDKQQVNYFSDAISLSISLLEGARRTSQPSMQMQAPLVWASGRGPRSRRSSSGLCESSAASSS